MRRILALAGCVVAMMSAAHAQEVSADMAVTPTHATSDVSFRATYTLKNTPCPTGQTIDFTWQSARHQTPLGSGALRQTGVTCTATLTTSPPATDRNPQAYTICGTYVTAEQQSIIGCADYRVDPGGPSSVPSPSGSPGTGTTGPGGATPPGGTGSPGTSLTPGAGKTAGATSSPGAPTATGGTAPPPRSGLRTAILALVILAVLTGLSAVYARSVLRG